MDDDNARSEVFRRAREHRARQDEVAIGQAVHEALQAGDVGYAVEILSTYGRYLEKRPEVLDDLPPVTRTEWRWAVPR